MATRCLINVKGYKISLYIHYDGYPKHIIPWLFDFSTRFIENRGNDPDYFLAQLLRDSVYSGEKFGLDESKFTGYGLFAHTRGLDVGQEYMYSVDLEKSTITILNVYDKTDFIIDLTKPLPFLAVLEAS